DGWELQYFGDLAQGVSGDPDGDVLVNGLEYAGGTDPTDTDTDGDLAPDGSDANGVDPTVQ
ncbi:MAG: hypothetical protein H6735_33360, partial [Alphaproteobacteria bacterium]|nr:hypothetical protein [Alphaproteobacteria bacterium]